MEFEWDEAKRLKVLRECEVDILYAARIFRGGVVTRRDLRSEYGEPRWISLGLVNDECVVVVHTERDGVVHLITDWKGGRDDRSR